MGKPGLGLQNFSFESLNQVYLHPTIFPGQSAPLVWLYHWAKLLVGTTWVLQVWIWSSRINVLMFVGLSLLLHWSQIPSHRNLQVPLQYMWGEIRMGALTKWPQCYKWVLVSPVGSFFPLEELEAQRRPLFLVLLWPGRGAMCSMCISSPLFSSNGLGLLV